MVKLDLVTRRASPSDLEQVTILLMQYLTFYKRDSDIDEVQSFILDRLEKQESIMFLAFDGKNSVTPIGLAHLYPMFSTLSQGKLWVLNDLFIKDEYRGLGVGKSLIDTVAEFAKSDGAFRIDLKTEHDNAPAKALYKRYGFSRDNVYVHYSIDV